MSTKKVAPAAPSNKKTGKAKVVLLATIGSLLLVGGGIGAGVYASRFLAGARNIEDPKRPKLVVRSETAQASGQGEGGEEKEPAPKIGTVSVTSDAVKVDPRRFEVTYVPLEQPFTANLANGGIVQVGLSFSTYYDHRVVENIKRQTVPIRSAALTILAEEDPAVLATSEGKQLLQRQLTTAVNTVLREKEGFGGVDNVYFTSLVIE
jgi:flagellar FliL protein